MFKFFRRIRQNVLAEGKTTKYFKYAIGEVMLVVIGILIALQINNWNEDKKIQAQTLEYIESIKADIINDTLAIDSLIAIGQKHIKHIEDFKTFFRQKNNPVNVLLDSSNNLPIGLYNYFPNNQTFTDMQSSGNSSLLSQQQRNALIELSNTQQRLTIANDEITDNILLQFNDRNNLIVENPEFYTNLNITPSEDILTQAFIHQYNFIDLFSTLANVTNRNGKVIKERSRKALELLE